MIKRGKREAGKERKEKKGKKRRKGLFLGSVLDLWGWLFYIIGMAVWFIVFTLSFGGMVADLSSSGGYTGDSLMLSTLLRAPTHDGLVLADDAVRAASGDAEAFSRHLDALLNSVYGQARKACWGAWADEELIASVECKGGKQELFNEEAKLPSPEGSFILRVAVLGYAE